jgi:hypothetical protein
VGVNNYFLSACTACAALAACMFQVANFIFGHFPKFDLLCLKKVLTTKIVILVDSLEMDLFTVDLITTDPEYLKAKESGEEKQVDKHGSQLISKGSKSKNIETKADVNFSKTSSAINEMTIPVFTKEKSSVPKEVISSKYYVPKEASKKEKKICSTFRQKKKKCRKTVSSSSEDSDARESAKLQEERIEMFDKHKAQRMKTKLKSERMQNFDFAQGENSDSMSLESIIEKVDALKAIPIVDFDKFNASDERHADKGAEKKHKKWLKWKKQQDKDAAKRREVAAKLEAEGRYSFDTAMPPENNLYQKYSDEDGELPDIDEGIQSSI